MNREIEISIAETRGRELFHDVVGWGMVGCLYGYWIGLHVDVRCGALPRCICHLASDR